MNSVRAEAAQTPVKQAEPAGLTLSPEQAAEARQIIAEIRALFREDEDVHGARRAG